MNEPTNQDNKSKEKMGNERVNACGMRGGPPRRPACTAHPRGVRAVAVVVVEGEEISESTSSNGCGAGPMDAVGEMSQWMNGPTNPEKTMERVIEIARLIELRATNE